jgi:glycerophosphoryl diester phosphodiesterase
LDLFSSYLQFKLHYVQTELTLNGFENRHGKKVFAWTVDDNNSMEKMLHEHVDAIVTSNPSLLQQLMHETRTECLEDGFALP